MRVPDVLISQYRAALQMLRQAVDACPDPLWNSADDRGRFWHIAYHVLFYAHLYLQDTVEAFRPWSQHRPGIHRFDPETLEAEPYDKAAILEYLDFCNAQVADLVPKLDLEAASGFDWLPCNKLELQIYGIRHIQQHTGELMERLGSRGGLELDWVSLGQG